MAGKSLYAIPLALAMAACGTIPGGPANGPTSGPANGPTSGPADGPTRVEPARQPAPAAVSLEQIQVQKLQPPPMQLSPGRDFMPTPINAVGKTEYIKKPHNFSTSNKALVIGARALGTRDAESPLGITGPVTIDRHPFVSTSDPNLNVVLANFDPRLAIPFGQRGATQAIKEHNGWFVPFQQYQTRVGENVPGTLTFHNINPSKVENAPTGDPANPRYTGKVQRDLVLAMHDVTNGANTAFVQIPGHGANSGTTLAMTRLHVANEKEFILLQNAGKISPNADWQGGGKYFGMNSMVMATGGSEHPNGADVQTVTVDPYAHVPIQRQIDAVNRSNAPDKVARLRALEGQKAEALSRFDPQDFGLSRDTRLQVKAEPSISAVRLRDNKATPGWNGTIEVGGPTADYNNGARPGYGQSPQAPVYGTQPGVVQPAPAQSGGGVTVVAPNPAAVFVGGLLKGINDEQRREHMERERRAAEERRKQELKEAEAAREGRKAAREQILNPLLDVARKIRGEPKPN